MRQGSVYQSAFQNLIYISYVGQRLGIKTINLYGVNPKQSIHTNFRREMRRESNFLSAWMQKTSRNPLAVPSLTSTSNCWPQSAVGKLFLSRCDWPFNYTDILGSMGLRSRCTTSRKRDIVSAAALLMQPGISWTRRLTPRQPMAWECQGENDPVTWVPQGCWQSTD